MADGLTVSEAAHYLGVETAEVMTYLKEGQLHIQRILVNGKAAGFRIAQEELDTLITSAASATALSDEGEDPEAPPPVLLSQPTPIMTVTPPKPRGRPARRSGIDVAAPTPRPTLVKPPVPAVSGKAPTVQTTDADEEQAALVVLADLLHDQLRVLIRLSQVQPMAVRDELWGLWLKQARMTLRVIADQFGMPVQEDE